MSNKNSLSSHKKNYWTKVKILKKIFFTVVKLIGDFFVKKQNLKFNSQKNFSKNFY
jgi:hypothetical protein